jgi:UDP:flavonoid glycosyltransferase YjiC (YdhE family)
MYKTYFTLSFSDVREVGYFLPGPAKPLPADLEKFMQSSGDVGVILVSFGSVIETLSDDIIQVMIKAFSKVPQKVIWKIGMFI